ASAPRRHSRPTSGSATAVQPMTAPTPEDEQALNDNAQAIANRITYDLIFASSVEQAMHRSSNRRTRRYPGGRGARRRGSQAPAPPADANTRSPISLPSAR